jgi:O-antigen/teichoic acid export membrane protein
VKIDLKGFVFLGLLSTAGNVVGMGFSYLFHFFMVRMLPQAAYGDLATLIGFVTVLSVPQGTLQAIIARETAIAEKKGDFGLMGFLVRKYAAKFFLLGLASGALGVIASILLLGASGPALPAAIAIFSSVPLAYCTASAFGYFQGRQQIHWVSLNLALNPLVRDLSAILLVFLGFGLAGAAAAFPLGVLAAAPIVALAFLTTRPERARKLSLRGALSLMVATNVLMTLTIYLDLFYVRFALGDDAAAIYNAASMTAKVLFFSAASLAIVIVPKASHLTLPRDRAQAFLLVAKAGALLAPVAMLFAALSEPIMTVFFTGAYSQAGAPFRILSIGLFFFALHLLQTNVLWAQKNEKAPLAINLAGALLLLPALALAVPAWGLQGAATATSAVSALLACASALALMRQARADATSPDTAGTPGAA